MIDNSGVARNNKAVDVKHSGLQAARWRRRGGGGGWRGLTCTELLCKFPGEIEGNSSEVGVPQKIIQIVA